MIRPASEYWSHYNQDRTDLSAALPRKSCGLRAVVKFGDVETQVSTHSQIMTMGSQPEGKKEDKKKVTPESQQAFAVSRRDLLAGTAATIACAFVHASSLSFAQATAPAKVLTVAERQSLEAIVSLYETCLRCANKRSKVRQVVARPGNRQALGDVHRATCAAQ